MGKRPDVFERLATPAPQTSVYKWMLRHHERFAAILSATNRPTWEAVARELTAEGLKTRDGSVLTAAYARNAWWRADKAIKAATPELSRDQATNLPTAKTGAASKPPKLGTGRTQPPPLDADDEGIVLPLADGTSTRIK